MKTYSTCDISVCILGAVYTLHIWPETADPRFEELNCSGFCDQTTRELFVSNLVSSNKKPTVADVRYTIRHAIKHEMVHAFMFESGLGEDWVHAECGQEETTVDWIARQLEKIHDTYETVIEQIKKYEIET